MSRLAPLRALIPSWRFFGDGGPRLRLRVRAGTPESPEPWLVLTKDGTREPFHLFFAPEPNHDLALRSLLERAVDETDNGVGLRLVERWCRDALSESRATSFQYEVTDLDEGEPLVLSAWLPR